MNNNGIIGTDQYNNIQRRKWQSPDLISKKHNFISVSTNYRNVIVEYVNIFINYS